MPKEINWISLAVCVIGVLAIGSLSGLANVGSIEGWYAALKKPSFSPPNCLFGPVWTLLYILLGVGLYLVFSAPQASARTTALIVFGVQLLLNFSWSFLFFYFKVPGVAFAEIIVLWCCIVLMIDFFFRVSATAAYLQIPYLLWVSFASVLNGSVWYLNK
jgi:tryptophan-rich sensory protein